MGIEYEVLGELRVLIDGSVVPLGGPRQRALLARLLLSRSQVVARDELVEDLYGSARSGAKALQVGIGRLRRSLGPHVLESHDGGYLLRADREQVDADRLADAVAAAERRQTDDEALTTALRSWRGTPLAELAGYTWARAESARLDELRVRALELRAEAYLDSGATQSALTELEQLVLLRPAREHLRELLMLALYRAGRQADALSAYRNARQYLVEEHGIEPGAALRDLHQEILLQDASLTAARTSSTGTDGRARVPTVDVDARPFVGRVSECAALDAALERCTGGQRIAAMVSGEPGIGKSRLAAEIVRRARAAGFVILEGRCDHDLHLPFKPFVEALGELPIPRDFADSDTQGLQYALFADIAGEMLQASREHPLLLVLDDLHWADRSSMLLLRHLLTTPVRPRMLVLGTYRSSDLGAGHPLTDLLADLHREPGVVRLELVGLLDGEVAELARIVWGDRAELPETAARELRRSTAGNPFFVTEVLHGLLETGDGALDPDALPVPASIRETVSARIARLGEPVAASLAAASVLGVTFDPELVAEVAERPQAEVVDALETALEAGLLLDEDDQLAFRHALIAQTLYEGLHAPRRRALHRRAANALTRNPSPEPAAVARQWRRAAPRGADMQHAREWARAAGDDALSKLAPHEAQRWYAQALELAATGTERCELLVDLGTAQRQAGNPEFRQTLLEAARLAHADGDDDALVRAALANTRGFVSATGGVDEERIAVLEQALAAVGPGATPARARLLAMLAGELSFTGDWERRTELSDEALAIAHELADPQTLVDVLSPRTVTIWSPATLTSRLVDTAECRRTADLLDDPIAQFQAVHWRASACMESGAFAEAAECRERGRQLAERIRQPTSLWMARYDQANEAIITGRLGDAERIANEAFQIGAASGQPDALLILASQLMVVRYEQGRLGEMVELVAQSLEQNPRITGFRSVLALGYCEERRFDDAAALLLADAADGFASLAYDLTWLSVTSVYAHVAARVGAEESVLLRLRELLVPWSEQVAYTGAGGWGLVEHYLGVLELALGDLTAARERLGQALRRAERMPAPIWAAHSRLELGRALLADGERLQAEELLRETSRAAQALGCASISREADESLAAVATLPR